MKKAYLLTVIGLALLSTTISAEQNLGLQISFIDNAITKAVTAYIDGNLEDTKKIIFKAHVETDDIFKSELYGQKIISRWKKIKKALTENDYETVRKKFIDHALWNLEVAIESSNYDETTNYLTMLENLKTRTDKQQARFAATLPLSQKIRMIQKHTIDWPTYLGGASLTIVSILLIANLKQKNEWNDNDLKTFVLSSIGVPFFGIATYLAYRELKRRRTDAPRIIDLLQEKFTKN